MSTTTGRLHVRAEVDREGAELAAAPPVNSPDGAALREWLSVQRGREALGSLASWAGALLIWPSVPAAGFALLAAGLVLLWRRRVATHVAVVSAVFGLFLGWAVLGVIASLPESPVLVSAASWVVGWCLVTAVVAASGWWVLGRLTEDRRHGRAVRLQPARVTGRARLLFLPAVLVGALGVFQGAVLDQVLRWIGYGTDSAVQLLLMEQLARDGSLAYGLNDGSRGDVVQQAYPKGLHWLATAVVQPALGGADPSTADAYAAYVKVFGAFVWLGIALVLLVAAGIYLSAAARWPLAGAAAGCATVYLLFGLAAPAQFAAVVVIQGGIGALGAVAAYWSLWWALIARTRLRLLLAVAVAVVIVTSNAWQPLLPITVATTGLVLLARLPGLWRSSRAGVAVHVRTVALSVSGCAL